MRYAFLSGPPARVAVVHTDDDLLIDLSAALLAAGDTEPAPQTPLDAIFAGGALARRVERAIAILMETGALDDVTLPPFAPRLAPIPRPNRILAIGRNYAEHAKELGNAVPDEPVVFLKGSNTVVGPDANIVAPDWLGRVDFEAELLVVLGRGGKNIEASDALSHVAAYTLFNDVTAREKSKALQGKGHPWFLAKSPDTFGPLGPHLVSADEIPDPSDVAITLTQNGELRQNGSTAQMIHSVPKLIAYLSRWLALEPGDCIATGTPSGVGPTIPGDILEITAERLGTLRNRVVA